MANFLKGNIKKPKQLKPRPLQSDVKMEEKPEIAEEEIPAEKIEEQVEQVEEISEKPEPTTKDEVKQLENVPYLDDEKKKKFKELKGSANSQVDLNKMKEELKEQEEMTEKIEEPSPEPEIAEEPIEESLPEPEVKEEPAEKPKGKPKEKPKEEPKSKKKSRSKKKEEPKELKESIGLDKAEEIMLPDIMPCSEDWEAEKERINNEMSKIMIVEEMDPTSVKAMLSDMSTILRELTVLTSEARTACTNLKELIDEIKVVNSVGVNSEERKLNGMVALKNYKKDDQIVDLTQLLKFYRTRQDFYESAMKELDINRQMLITFGSVFKIELGKCY